MAENFAASMQCYHGDTDKESEEGCKMTDDLEIEAKGEVPVEVPEEEVAADDNVDDMLHKSTVSKIVSRERQKADAKGYERGKKEALMQLQQENMQPQAEQQPAQAPSSIGGMPQYSQEDIQRMIAQSAPQILQETIQGQLQQLQNKQLVDSFVNKMQVAEQKYPGLEKQLSELDYESMTPLIKLANNMENTGDIMKELIDNPMKMGNLMTLVYAQPKMAERAMMELSGSIKQNQDALAQEAQARDPMSQLKPSSSAGLASGPMSVSDFRKMFSSRRR